MLEGKFLYSELIEIIPQDLEPLFNDKKEPLSQIDNNLILLLNEAGLTDIKIWSNYD
jgi:hypothetical protein